MSETTLIPFHSDYRLALLSLGFSILTSYIALGLAGRMADRVGRSRYALLTGSAVAMACGIWGTHVLDLLAYRVRIELREDIAPFALSLPLSALLAVLAAGIAEREHLTRYLLIPGSLAAGVGIGVMQYAGVAAIRIPAAQHHHRDLLLLFIACAVLICYLNILLLARARTENLHRVARWSSACVMGMSMPLLHATGMASVYLAQAVVSPPPVDSIDTATAAALTISIATFLVLGIAILILRRDRLTCTQNLALDNERNMLRALVDNIPEFMYVKDPQHRLIVANVSLARFLGMEDPDQLLGKTDADFFPAELARSYKEDEVNVLLTGQGLYNHEERCIDCHGNEILILSTKVPLKTRDGKLLGIAGVGRDITVHTKMEHALREAELKYRGIFNKAVVGIFQCTPEGQLLSVNPSMAFSFGYATPEEMVETITDISTQFFANPMRGKEFMTIMKKVGGVKNFECEAFCQDGSTIWLTMSTRCIREKGTILRFEGVCDDISERMQMRSEILQTQKLEAVGQLAAGIAHEINTPTQFIGDNVRFLKDNFPDLITLLTCYRDLLAAASADAVTPELLRETELAVQQADTEYLIQEIPKAIDQTMDGVGRIASIVSAMQEFSHPGSKEKIPLDLNHTIENTIVVSRNEWKYVAQMETKLDPALPMIDCLPGEFSQVILNLIVNAAHAIADAAAQGGPALGLIRITTRNSIDSIEITVADSGTGIPKDVQSRIFDPFFTTKKIGKGTGQGLSIARSVIVDKHSGSIHFETIPGEGTTFIIRLPKDGKLIVRKQTIA